MRGNYQPTDKLAQLAPSHNEAAPATRSGFVHPFCASLPLQPPSSVDLTTINLRSTIAVNYWCQALNCTETRLRNAVLAVGLLPADVRAYLSR